MMQRVDTEWPNESVSSFTESIIVATLCGRALNHKQRRSAVSPQQQQQQQQQHALINHFDRQTDPTYDFCRRHRSLSSLLSQHMKMLHFQSSLPMENPDPTHVFVALAICLAIFMLYETIESHPRGADAQAAKFVENLLTEHKKLTLETVHELSALINALGQLNHFQVSTRHWGAILEWGDHGCSRTLLKPLIADTSVYTDTFVMDCEVLPITHWPE